MKLIHITNMTRYGERNHDIDVVEISRLTTSEAFQEIFWLYIYFRNCDKFIDLEYLSKEERDATYNRILSEWINES